MLILSRKINESIVIDGRIVIKILRIDKDNVKLGIQAPPEVSVHRQEIQDLIEKGQTNGSKTNHLPPSRTGVSNGAEVGAPPRVAPPGTK
jgi:carbon storage regulator